MKHNDVVTFLIWFSSWSFWHTISQTISEIWTLWFFFFIAILCGLAYIYCTVLWLVTHDSNQTGPACPFCMWKSPSDIHDSCPGTLSVHTVSTKQDTSDLKLSMFKCPPPHPPLFLTSCSLVDSATLCEPWRQLGWNEGMPCTQPLSLSLSVLPLSLPLFEFLPLAFSWVAIFMRCI